MCSVFYTFLQVYFIAITVTFVSAVENFLLLMLVIRVLNRPEFSGRHDFQAEKFGRQCAKSGSHAVGLQENLSKKLT